MLSVIYKFELKKLFLARVNMIALTGSVVMLLFLVVSSVTEERSVSREIAEELNGRALDGQLLDELRPSLLYVNGRTVMEVTEENEKYVPLMDVLDVMVRAVDEDLDLTGIRGMELYEIRERELSQRLEMQGLSQLDKEFWKRQEAQVPKPFVCSYHRGPGSLLRAFQALGFFVLLLSAIGLSGAYAGETADGMNQLLLCSRYGKKELYSIKLAAGFTWILTVAMIVFLTVMIPYFCLFGMDGMGEMLQLVKPLSMLPCSIGHMLAVYFGIYMLAAVLYASVTMLLSVITQSQLTAVCGLMGYLLIDLFVEVPDRYRALQKIWSLRPNAVLMNTGFSNYRLIHLAGRFFLNYQAAPVLYVLIVFGAVLIGRWKYHRLQVEK